MKYVINEGALNDDTLQVADEGMVFVNGHVRGKFLVTYWTFANTWCNAKHQFIAKTLENALKRYKRETKREIPEDIEYGIEY